MAAQWDAKTVERRAIQRADDSVDEMAAPMAAMRAAEWGKTMVEMLEAMLAATSECCWVESWAVK